MKNVQEAVTMQKTADEVTVKQVHIKDDFWSEIQNRIINVVIPFQEHVLNDEVEGVAKSHAIENFRIAAFYFVGIINVIIVLCHGILLIERPEPLP